MQDGLQVGLKIQHPAFQHRPRRLHLPLRYCSIIKSVVDVRGRVGLPKEIDPLLLRTQVRRHADLVSRTMFCP